MSRPVTDLFPVSSVFRLDRRMNYGPGMLYAADCVDAPRHHHPARRRADRSVRLDRRPGRARGGGVPRRRARLLRRPGGPAGRAAGRAARPRWSPALPDVEPSAPWESGGWRYRRVMDAGPGVRAPRAPSRRRARRSRRPCCSTCRPCTTPAARATRATACSRSARTAAGSRGRSTSTGDEVYALRFRDLLDRGRPRRGRAAQLLQRRLVGRLHARSSTPCTTTPTGPTRCGCHVLGTSGRRRRARARGPRRAARARAAPVALGRWVVIALLGRGFSRGACCCRPRDVTAAPRLVRARELGVEYQLEHAPGLGPDGADGFLVMTNLDAPEFRVVWAPVDDPSRVDAVPRRGPGAARAGASTRSRTGSCCRCAATARRCCASSPREGSAFDVRARRTPAAWCGSGATTTGTPTRVTVATDSFVRPTVWCGPRVGRRAHRAAPHRGVGVDHDVYVSERRSSRRPPTASRVPVILVRHRGHAARRHGAVRALRLRLVRGAVRPRLGHRLVALAALAARPWRRLRGRPPARRRRDGPPLVGGRPPRGEARTRSTTRRRSRECLLDGVVSSVVSRGLSAGGLLQGALYAQPPAVRAASSPRCRSSTSSPRCSTTSLPADRAGVARVGRPARPRAGRLARGVRRPMRNLPDVGDRPPLLATGAVHDPRVLVREPARWVARLRASDPAQGAGRRPGRRRSRRAPCSSARDRGRRARRPVAAASPSSSTRPRSTPGPSPPSGAA